MQENTFLTDKLAPFAPLLMTISLGQFLSGLLSTLVSVVILIYYLSILKINVINPHYGKSWLKYIKSIFKKDVLEKPE